MPVCQELHNNRLVPGIQVCRNKARKIRPFGDHCAEGSRNHKGAHICQIEVLTPFVFTQEIVQVQPIEHQGVPVYPELPFQIGQESIQTGTPTVELQRDIYPAFHEVLLRIL